MPEKATVEKAKRKLRAGDSPSTAAGEFVREEIHHIREGKHGARSTKQAIAIGLSKARRAGVPLGAPRKGTTSRATRKAAKRDLATGQGKRKPTHSRARSRAMTKALKREPRKAASHRALARHARTAAKQRTRADRSAAARKAVATKGAAGRRAAARKAAATRKRRARKH
jgi:hypothetical protein